MTHSKKGKAWNAQAEADAAKLAAAEQVIREAIETKLGLGFHPDTPAEQYVDAKGARTYNDAQANQLNEAVNTLLDFSDPYVFAESEWIRLGLVRADEGGAA